MQRKGVRMGESKTLEFKETVTNTFLKTVSAFANFGTGEIRFGVNDEGVNVGLEDIGRARLDIENRINDSIHPKPEYHFVTHEKSKVLSLIVSEGPDKPYLYKGKAYQRSDTATIEVDLTELRRLTLAGTHQNFEQLHSQEQDLTFHALEEKMKEILGIQKLNRDILKTLNLYDDDNGYNNAGALIADENEFPGIDIARFGDDIDVIRNRRTVREVSILTQYMKAVEFYNENYKEEVIDGIVRRTRELVPEKAFREAVANALVHRTWDIDANVHISMFDDRIEVISVGGLPFGMSREEYLRGGVSVLRNPILANVFYRLHYIEAFGTGVLRIRNAYREYNENPEFEITDNTIRITLPVLNRVPQMTREEKKIYDVLSGHRILSSSEIASELGFTKSKTNRLLNRLVDEHIVVKSGQSRGTRYHL